MKDEHSFERMREDLEPKQKATVWPDTIRNGRSVDAFLWKGDPKARPVQRIGLAIFALAFLLPATTIASIPFQKKFEDGWSIELFLALLAFLLSMRFLRNGFLRPPSHQKGHDRSK